MSDYGGVPPPRWLPPGGEGGEGVGELRAAERAAWAHEAYSADEVKARMHVRTFSSAERSCSNQCASSCKAALGVGTAAATALAQAERAAEQPLYVTWLSIVDQV